MENIIYPIAFILKSALTIYLYMVIASAVLSWVNPDPHNPIVRFLRNATEPVYAYIRKYMPFLNLGGIDLSPIVLILAIQFVQIAVVGSLVDFAGTMGVQPGGFYR